MPLGYGQLTPAFWVQVVFSYNFSFVSKEGPPPCLVVPHKKEKIRQMETKELEQKVH